jgi:membrane-bound metal-dependent hydrolase YbcI (DUF457 family)
MLIGHYAIALAAKSIDRKPALGSFFLATQLLDFVWIILLVLGLESVALNQPIATEMSADLLRFKHQPYSHSLIAACFWGLAFAAWCYRGRLADGNPHRALLLGLVVSSHWWLDLLVHQADLPIVLGSGAKVGAALWQHAGTAFWLELILLLVCFALYCRRTKTRPETRTSQVWFERRAAWWPAVLLVSLVIVHCVSNYMGSVITALNGMFGGSLKPYSLVFVQFLLLITWLGLPILAFLTLDRVRGARI